MTPFTLRCWPEEDLYVSEVLGRLRSSGKPTDIAAAFPFKIFTARKKKSISFTSMNESTRGAFHAQVGHGLENAASYMITLP